MAILASLLVTTSAHADIFGVPALRTRNVLSIPKWVSVLERTRAENLRATCAAGTCEGKQEKWWEKLPTWRAMGRFDQLVVVNRWMNNYPYITDMDLLGMSDFWQTPGQFIVRSGDCEDYAIAKYYTLKALGWPESSLRLVVVHDAVRDIPHAVLAVTWDGEDYILDNLASEPLPDKYVRQYTPYYAINADHRWVFIK
jgi:predicted transglutaminase-like cysteine proteinase